MDLLISSTKNSKFRAEILKNQNSSIYYLCTKFTDNKRLGKPQRAASRETCGWS